MPDIQLILGSDPNLWEQSTKAQILSYVLFPKEEAKRRGFLALQGGELREEVRTVEQEVITRWNEGRDLPKPSDPQSFEAERAAFMELVATDLCDPFGGATAIAQLPPAEKRLRQTRASFQDCLRVGLMFRLLIDFHHHYEHQTTLADIIPVFQKHPALIELRKDMQWRQDKNFYVLWDRYKRVAHLCATFSCLVLADYLHCIRFKKNGIEPFVEQHKNIVRAWFLGAPPFEETDIDLSKFLGLAREYQRFGRSYRPKQSTRPLIHDNAWLIPETWDLPSFNLPRHTPPHSFRRIFENNSRTLAA